MANYISQQLDSQKYANIITWEKCSELSENDTLILIVPGENIDIFLATSATVKCYNLDELGASCRDQNTFDHWEAAQILSEIKQKIDPERAKNSSPPPKTTSETTTPASPACFLHEFKNW